jgi:hypothetical protein
MKHFWEYFSTSFDNPVKVYRIIKKTDTLPDYTAKVEQLLFEN